MNERITKPRLIKRIVDLLKHRNKKYTQEDVEVILSAFRDIVIESPFETASITIQTLLLVQQRLTT